MIGTFPDGAHYRIEVSGVETIGILKAVVDEAKKLGIPVHRTIATVKGSSFYSDSELAALAHLAAKEKIEVIICPWKLAALVFKNPNRILNWSLIRLIQSRQKIALFSIRRFFIFPLFSRCLLVFKNDKTRYLLLYKIKI